MKKKKLIINFLFDKSNDWISKFILRKNFKRSNILIKKYFDFKKIKKQDIVCVLGYTKKLPENFIKNNKYVLIIHESPLPKGKGFSPLQWQILENKKKITACLFSANNYFDSGDILLREQITLDGTELYDEIREKQATTSIKLINKFLKSYPFIKKIRQKGESSFYRKRSPKDSELDIKKSIISQFNKLRIANNNEWPSFFVYKNQKYILKIFKKNCA